MKYGSDLYAKIELEYERRRREAREKSDFYKDKMLAIPDFAAAVERLKKARFEAAKARFDGDERKRAEELAKIEKETEILRKIQEENGVTTEMLRPAFTCAKCKDTGINESGKTCECYYSVALKVALETLGIKEKDFADFKNVKHLDKNNLKAIYGKIKKYCDTFGVGSKNILLSGNVGTGKSHLAECIAGELVKKGFAVVFLTATELNGLLLRYHTASFDEKNLYFEILTDCDLLVIDDLGTEPQLKNVTVNYLLTVLSERLSNDMPYIVTTNLTQDEIISKYDERIHSRLLDKKHGVHIEIKGEDLRLLK